ncbi:transcription factor TFIID complex subunit Taf7 [Schizosaccharomyces japonicus yFS275]|uniref:Transcription factor TFIID complex subunit Taf7 n=1 Tax=Schizosaccharomyces japonicus (strain yFS275 / FY16936) TaxID=402676 RepID=B6JYY5_SCHJY|nr:transcription factor TFIID complex subunit Taf7 [Schizosaccharomyces japonicus yFS275]EEB06753.1 transcription factor TFIID complex subunit Taf7 [Schizosaccharomyces japonicus yFS275]
MVKLKIKAGPPPSAEPKIHIKAPKANGSGVSKIRIRAARDSSNPRPTKIRLKRAREPGLGYDSEASDREEDPYIEEQIMLRMPPGEDCDYVRKAIENREVGRGADIWIKFKDNRRAVIHVNGHMYAAKLVDLPCIIESSKSYDKKVVFKTADISQMLLVEKRIEHEDDVPMDPLKLKDYVYPHGVTPPMHWVRQKRFRKRVSNRTIEAVEAEVDRLLALDEQAETSIHELIDSAQLARESSMALSEDMSFNNTQFRRGETTEREESVSQADLFDGMDEDDLAGQIEQGMLELNQSTTRETTAETHQAADESASDEDEEEEDEDDNDADDETRENKRQNRLVREFISELESSIQKRKRDADEATNPILRNRFLADVNRMVTELELKRAQLEDNTDK